MPAKVAIIHAHEFIRVTEDGNLDLKEAKRLLRDIATASSGLTEYEIIVDVRNAKLKLTTTDIWYLAAELGSFNKTFSRKTAVITSPEGFDREEFFALCAKNRGFPVSAFTSFEDAIDWLFRTDRYPPSQND